MGLSPAFVPGVADQYAVGARQVRAARAGALIVNAVNIAGVVEKRSGPAETAGMFVEIEQQADATGEFPGAV